MLDRLEELREAARDIHSEPHPQGDDKVASAEPHVDLAVQTALAQDAMSWTACDDLRAEVESFEAATAQVQRVVLPSKLQQFTASLKTQEDIVQTRVHRAKALIDTLRCGEPDAQRHVVRIRENLAYRVTGAFKELVQRYFNTRQGHREEMLRRARRQLRIAFPEARDEALEDMLEYPELAAIAIARRLERGANAPGASIGEVLSELDSTRGDLIRLEDGARELKAMFFKFAELVDAQGEALNSVEAQVHEASDHIAGAVAIYKQAERSKEESDWRIWSFRLKVFLFLAVVFCLFNYTLVFRSAYWAATGVVKCVAGAGAAIFNSFHEESKLHNWPMQEEIAIPAGQGQTADPSGKLPTFLEVQTTPRARSKRLQSKGIHDFRPSSLSTYSHSRSEVSAEGVLRNLHVSDSLERLIAEGSHEVSSGVGREGEIKGAETSAVASMHLRTGHA